MRRLRKTIHRHFNCIPWLIVGIQILAEGNISKLQYGLCWICTLILIWHYCPNKGKISAEYVKENEKWVKVKCK